MPETNMRRRGPRWKALGRLALTCACVLATAVSGMLPAYAQDGDQDTGETSKKRVALRVLTDSGFPPFNFYDEDGILTGFNVDLARAICLELELTCDIQVRPWAQLMSALQSKEADAVVAGHAVSAELVDKVTFTNPYFRTPGRFAVHRDSSDFPATPEGLEGRRIGVVQGTAHEAFIRRFFLSSRIEGFPDPEAAREALVERRIDALFDDAVSLAFWLNGTMSKQCCAFRSGAYLEPRFFGDGIAIAVRKDDLELRAELNRALAAVRKSGRFQELVSRYFPFQIY